MNNAVSPLAINVRVSIVATAVSVGADTIYFEPLPGGGVLVVACCGDHGAVFCDQTGTANRPATLSLRRGTVESVVSASEGIENAKMKIESVDAVPWLNIARTAHHSYASHHVAEVDHEAPDWRAIMVPELIGVAA